RTRTRRIAGRLDAARRPCPLRVEALRTKPDQPRGHRKDPAGRTGLKHSHQARCSSANLPVRRAVPAREPVASVVVRFTMGMLVQGEWVDRWYDTAATRGRFERSESAFRNWVTSDGASGPSGVGGFRAEPGRYHLYVSLACPWAHRTLILRRLKNLED